MEKMTGVRAEDIVGRSDMDYSTIFYGKKQQILIDYVLEQREAEIPKYYPGAVNENGFSCTDIFCPGLHKGKGAYVYAKVSALYGCDGKMIGAVEIVQDITQGKANKLALEKHTKELIATKAKDEAILNSIGDGLIATNAKNGGQIILINKRAEEMLGVSARDVYGKALVDAIAMQNENGDIIGDKQRLITESLVRNITSTVSSTGPSNYYARKNGSRFPIAATVTPIRLRGKIIGAVEIFRDITREKEIDKQKNEFISLASHQLRTPTTAMNWYCEMLQDETFGKLTPKQTEYINEISHGNHRMIELVNALLTVSRIELGTFTIEPRRTPLDEIIETLLKELHPEIEKKSTGIIKYYESDALAIQSDPTLVQMIVQNLLANAIDYSVYKGRVTIRISRTGTKAEPKVKIRVHNRGHFISAQDHKKVFTKFFRTDDARLTKPDGNGLGLYIAKSVAEALGGNICFSSSTARGTSFCLCLPAKSNSKKDARHK
jgi:PAS domain S-box-containing protein